MKNFVLFTASFVLSFSGQPSLFSQSSEKVECKSTPEEEALERANFEVLSKRFQSQIEGIKSPAEGSSEELRRQLVTFVASELKATKLTADQIRLLKWQKNEAEKLKLLPILSSEISMTKELEAAGIVSKAAEIEFVSQSIRDEDIRGLGDNGKLRLMNFDSAKKAKDIAVRKAVERFEKEHGEDNQFMGDKYLVIELNSEMLGRNGATSLRGHRIAIKSATEIVITEEIHINEKPDMFFTENIVNRPRKLMFIKIDQGGLQISPTAKLSIDQTKIVDK